jgi:hypothetical protein
MLSTMRSQLKSLISSLIASSQADEVTSKNDTPTKTWEASQQYEWEATVKFMSSSEFQELALRIRNDPSQKISNGYSPKLTITEFFGGLDLEWHAFIRHISGKTCLEIGSCTSSILSGWDTAAERFVIEPLADKVSAWQCENLGFSLYEGLTTYSLGADQYIEALERKVDGAIFCRNCIDHSPDWAFILSNISSYALPGCRLLLWNDIFHLDGTDSGHYDLTKDPYAMKRLISRLGFDIMREYNDSSRRDLNWGCFAIKN